MPTTSKSPAYPLIGILASLHALHLSRAMAILIFSWLALDHQSGLLPFAIMLLVSELISLLLSPIVGKYINHYGARVVYVVGELTFSIGALAYIGFSAFFPDLGHVLSVVAYAVISLSCVMSYPSSQSLLRSVTSGGSGTRNASLSNLVSTLAYVIGPIASGSILSNAGAAVSLGVCVVASGLALIPLIFSTRHDTVLNTPATPMQLRESETVSPGHAPQVNAVVTMIAINYSAFVFLTTYLAPLAYYQLKTDADGLGTLRSSWSIGALIGTSLLALASSFIFRVLTPLRLTAVAFLWATALASLFLIGSWNTAVPLLLACGLLFALTRSSFDGLLLQQASIKEFATLKTRAQARASAISLLWIALAALLPPNNIGYGFLVFAVLILSGATHYLLRTQRPLLEPSKV